MKERHIHPSAAAVGGRSAVSLLVSPDSALQAARRLEQAADHGLRFYCEHREVLSLRAARERDALEARRKRPMPADRDTPAALREEAAAQPLPRNHVEDDFDDEDTDAWDADIDLLGDEAFETEEDFEAYSL